MIADACEVSPVELPLSHIPSADGAEPRGLEIRLFGLFELSIDGMAIPAISRRDGDRILAFLILQERPVSKAAVADTFWPGTGSQESLRQSLTSMRRALGDHAWRLGGQTGALSFDTTGASVDVIAFDNLARSDRLEDLLSAAALHRAPLLDERHEEWARKARSDRKRILTDLLHRASHLARDCGDLPRSCALLHRLTRVKPTMEHAWSDLMAVLVASGERAVALEQYAAFSAYLKSRHGLAPSPEMEAMHTRLRTDEGRPSDPASAPVGRSGVGGAVPLSSTLYVQRTADVSLAAALDRGESIIRIQGPRQTGKSSVLARGLQHARALGNTTYVLEFERLAAEDLASMKTLCLRVASILAAQLDGDPDPGADWSDAMGPGVNLERFVLRHVLGEKPTPVVIAMDDVDRLFTYCFASDFFALLRAWHGRHAFEPDRPLGRLTMALVFATDAHLYLKNLNHSPFNVGARIAVEDLSADELEELVRRYGATFGSRAERAQFHVLVGGHAYFACKALQAMEENGWSVAELGAHAGREDGPLADSLGALWRLLGSDADLVAEVKAVLAGRRCSDAAFDRLRSGGILAGEPERPLFRSGVLKMYLEAHA